MDWPGGWRKEITSILAPLQRDDGSFVNTRNHLMKEDDPLLATALAVIAKHKGWSKETLSLLKRWLKEPKLDANRAARSRCC